MPEQYIYYKDEMARILPVDQYGVSIKIRTQVGQTKWLALNPDCFKNLQEIFKEQITAEGQAQVILKKWLASLDRDPHAVCKFSGVIPAELVAETLEFLGAPEFPEPDDNEVA
jgi:hypothetical protein